MAGPPPQWPFAGVAPPGVAASGAQWFSGFAGEAGTPQNPAGPFAGEGARAGAAGASSGGGAGPGAPGPSGSAGASDAGDSAPGARVAKVRKPYTITKQRERWTDDEHERFLAALKLHGRAWRKIEEHVGTKSAVQIRSHAQKFFSKLQRETQRAKREAGEAGAEGAEPNANAVHIPPARPKRKPSHPYPRKAPEHRNRAEKKSSAAAPPLANDASANPLHAFTAMAGHHFPMLNPALMFGGVSPQGPQGSQGPQGPQGPQGSAAQQRQLAAFVAAARGVAGGPPASAPFPDAGVAGRASPFAASNAQQHYAQTQEEMNRLAAASAGGFGALFASNPMALAQMASASASATPQAAQAAQAAQVQQFFAALAAVGGALPGGAHANAGAAIVEPGSTNAPAEVQRPAARPTGDAAAAADVYAAMLAAAAARPAGAPGAAAAAASRGAPSPLAGALSSGSAFTAFADPGMPIPPVSGLENSATGPSACAAPSAEQINALADVMLFFPNGGAVPGDKVAAAFARGVPKTSEGAPSSAERIERIDANGPNAPVHSAALPTVPTVREAKDGKEDGARAPDSRGRGPSSSGGGGSGDDDGGSGSDRGGGGSGDRGGSGSGSGEGGSGQSAQTKASNGRGTDGRGGRVSRGFESSSQREPSPPQPRR